jgi:hypothetical protein
MNEPMSASLAARRSYEPPTVTRVHVDPVRELLLQTGCLRNLNENDTCNQNPCTGGGV